MFNKKIASELAVGTILLVAIGVGVIIWMENENAVIGDKSSVIENPPVNVTKEERKEDVACIMDVKLCDNGSSVGRIGPNCEFAECPIINSYKNDKFGFEFKYAADLKVTADDYTDPEILKNKDGVLAYVDFANAKDGDTLLDLRIDRFQLLEDNSKLKVMTDYWYKLRVAKTSADNIEKYISSWELKFKQGGGGIVDPQSLLDIQNIMINGIDAKKLSFDGGNLIISSIIFIRDGYAYDFNLSAFDLDGAEMQKARLSFDEAVSTFRFVE